MDTENDRRHLHQVQLRLAQQVRLGSLRRFDNVEALGRLISELESLGMLLETPLESWRRSFQEQWGTLEEVFAVALDRGALTLDEEGADLVAQAVSKLSFLVSDALARLPPERAE